MPFEAFSYVDENGEQQRFRKCPRYMVEAGANVWVSLYAHYNNGHLYRPGGVADQPAKYLEAMSLIQSEANTTDYEDGKQ